MTNEIMNIVPENLTNNIIHTGEDYYIQTGLLTQIKRFRAYMFL